MDIQAIGAWGELIGGISGLVAAIAVVGSLVFVGLQVRNNTETLRLTARQAMLESVQRNGLCITEDAEFADIVVRGSKGETLGPVERLRMNQSDKRVNFVTGHTWLCCESILQVGLYLCFQCSL